MDSGRSIEQLSGSPCTAADLFLAFNDYSNPRICNSPVDTQYTGNFLTLGLYQLNLSTFLSDRVMVGAALSRECIAHECAPTAMPNMFDENVCSQLSSELLGFCG